MMPLPKEKSNIKKSLSEYSLLIYGPEKIGKSTIASKFPNAVFLATEAGLNSLSVYKDDVTKWDQFLENCKELASGKHSFETIVIDTVDNLYKLCSDYVCNKLGIKHESDLGYGKGFAMVNSEFQRTLTKLSLLPYGLILISHSQEKDVDTRLGKVKKIVPTLPEAARKIVLGMVDIVLYIDVEPIKDDNGKVKEYKRIFRTKPTTYITAGDRTNRLPEVLDLSYESLVEAFRNGKSEVQKTNNS